MKQRFVEFLKESGKGLTLADIAKGKGRPARANYPKTNFKRFVDEWNTRLGEWVRKHEKMGCDVKKRVNANPESPMIIDAVNDDQELVATFVVTGSDDISSGKFTFDMYNQHKTTGDNPYRTIPNRTSYEKNWSYAEITGENLHANDTRNAFTSSGGGNMASNRVKDGDQGAGHSALLRTPKNRKPVKFVDQPKD